RISAAVPTSRCHHVDDSEQPRSGCGATSPRIDYLRWKRCCISELGTVQACDEISRRDDRRTNPAYVQRSPDGLIPFPPSGTARGGGKRSGYSQLFETGRL